MRTPKQQTSIITQAMKNLHIETARKWGIPVDVITGATFGLGVTMMVESGYSEDQIVEIVRSLVADLGTPPNVRGAS